MRHHYKRDRKQQTGFSPVVSTLLKLKRGKRPPFGEKKMQNLCFGLKASPFYRPKLVPPDSEACPISMLKTARADWGGPASTFLPQVVLSMPDRRWKLQANQTQHQRHARPALWNSHHVTVSAVKVNYILTCRLKFPHLFFTAQITSSDKTEPNF